MAMQGLSLYDQSTQSLPHHPSSNRMSNNGLSKGEERD